LRCRFWLLRILWLLRWARSAFGSGKSLSVAFQRFLEEQQSRTQSFEFILGITIAETVSDKEQTALVSSTESTALLTRPVV
jgi:hypothetical protein